MKNSIIQDDKTVCYLCGERGGYWLHALDKHHVFFGPYRKNSEKYGLTVYLHHDTCHIFGEDAVHVNADIDRELKAEVQKLAMDYYGWDTDTARQICGKNYI